MKELLLDSQMRMILPTNQCPIELEDPQNHLIKLASEAEWNELEHVTIKLSQGARDYVAGYMAVKVSTESVWGSFFCNERVD